MLFLYIRKDVINLFLDYECLLVRSVFLQFLAWIIRKLKICWYFLINMNKNNMLNFCLIIFFFSTKRIFSIFKQMCSSIKRKWSGILTKLWGGDCREWEDKIYLPVLFSRFFGVLEGVYENSPWDEGWKGEGIEGGNDKKHEWCIFIDFWIFCSKY